jgi:integrase
MPKVIKEAPITTANARSKLPAGQHLRQLDPDAHLIYAKGARGGVWRVRWRNRLPGAAYLYAPVGPANDRNEDRTNGGLVFDQAERAARQIVETKRAEAAAAEAGPVATVRSVVESYIDMRDARDTRRVGRPVRSDAAGRLTRYVIGREAHGKRKSIAPAPLAAVALYELDEGHLTAWRNALSSTTLSASGRRRLINDLKAALNLGWSKLPKEQKERNPLYLASVKSALEAEAADDETEAPVRDNQILTDTQRGAILRAARDLGDDLYRLIVVLDATGARYKQAYRMKVAHLQVKESRLLVPGSYKGRGGKADPIPVPITADVLEVLLPAVAGCKPSEPLLTREHLVQEAGAFGKWKSIGRRAWKKSELTRPWQSIRERAGLAKDIDAYSLRHTSIVRGLRDGLPESFVAKRHNTSEAMIRRHYGRFIVSAFEELEREKLAKRPSVLPVGDSNVTQIAGRA